MIAESAPKDNGTTGWKEYIRLLIFHLVLGGNWENTER